MAKSRLLFVVLAFAGALLALPAAASAITLGVSPSPAQFPATTVNSQSQPLEVQLTNPGPGPAIVENIQLGGPDAGEFTLNGNCGGPIMMGEKCSLSLSLKPTSLGHKEAEISFAVNGEGPQSFLLEGDSVAPELAFEPASHDFGLVPVNRERPRFDFSIKNVGAGAANVDAVELVGPGSSDGSYGFSWNCPGTLEPGSTCTASVEFEPHQAGPHDAELRVRSGAATATATLTGTGGEAVVRAGEEPVQMGAVAVGGAVVRTITLTNQGNIAAGFFLSVLAGGDPGSFQLLSESCTFVEVAPGASCTATVRFAPIDLGPKNARIAFFGDGDGAGILALHGEGVAAPPAPPVVRPSGSLGPASFRFASVRKGHSGKARTFTLRNDGSVPLSLERAAIVGENVDQFRLAGDECSGEVLAPGGECLLRVRFAPRSRGTKAAKLRVWGEGVNFDSRLEGRGTVPPSQGGDGQSRRHRAL